MAKRSMSLEQVRVDEPCTASWEAMRGDARNRYCDHCRKTVHDLSAMTRAEADAVLNSADGHTPCVRFLADRMGVPLTRERIGLAGRWLHRQRRWWAVAAAIGFIANLAGCQGAVKQSQGSPMAGRVAASRTMGIVSESPAATLPAPTRP